MSLTPLSLEYITEPTPVLIYDPYYKGTPWYVAKITPPSPGSRTQDVLVTFHTTARGNSATPARAATWEEALTVEHSGEIDGFYMRDLDKREFYEIPDMREPEDMYFEAQYHDGEAIEVPVSEEELKAEGLWDDEEEWHSLVWTVIPVVNSEGDIKSVTVRGDFFSDYGVILPDGPITWDNPEAIPSKVKKFVRELVDSWTEQLLPEEDRYFEAQLDTCETGNTTPDGWKCQHLRNVPDGTVGIVELSPISHAVVRVGEYADHVNLRRLRILKTFKYERDAKISAKYFALHPEAAGTEFRSDVQGPTARIYTPPAIDLDEEDMYFEGEQ